MPYIERLPPRKRKFARGTHVAGYLAAAIILGGIGLSWPPDYALAGWALLVTRAAGGCIVVAGLAAAWAHWRERWLIELEALPVLGLALTGYALVLLLWVGPAREWLLMLGFIVVVLLGMAGRSVHLTEKVGRFTKVKVKAGGGQGGPG